MKNLLIKIILFVIVLFLSSCASSNPYNLKYYYTGKGWNMVQPKVHEWGSKSPQYEKPNGYYIRKENRYK